METTLAHDGTLSITGLPFRKGDTVEVIVLAQKHTFASNRYPLRGEPIHYAEPYESVAEEDWVILK